MCAKELERIEKRIQVLPIQESRTTWVRQERQVETRELVAELVVPLTIIRADGPDETRRLEEQLRVVDRLSAADKSRSLPGDPDDLPSAREARHTLEQRIDALLEQLTVELRRHVQASLLPRAEKLFREGQNEPAIELLVRALVDATDAPGACLRSDAAALLERWTEHTGETVVALAPSP